MKPSLLILVSIILVSCSPAYVPNVRNVVLYKKAGEVQGKVFYSPFINNGGHGFDAQIAASITNHIAITGAYEQSSNPTIKPNDDKSIYFTHHMAEAGLGYYTNLKKGRFHLQVIGGYGQGTSRVFKDYPDINNQITGFYTFDYERYFISTTLGFIRKGFSIGVTPRISYVNFTSYKTDVGKFSLNDSYNIFIEPAITVQYDLVDVDSPVLSHFVFTGQFGLNFSPKRYEFNSDRFNNQYEYAVGTFAIGMGVRFGGETKESVSGN